MLNKTQFYPLWDNNTTGHELARISDAPERKPKARSLIQRYSIAIPLDPFRSFQTFCTNYCRYHSIKRWMLKLLVKHQSLRKNIVLGVKS